MIKKGIISIIGITCLFSAIQATELDKEAVETNTKEIISITEKDKLTKVILSHGTEFGFEFKKTTFKNTENSSLETKKLISMERNKYSKEISYLNKEYTLPDYIFNKDFYIEYEESNKPDFIVNDDCAYETWFFLNNGIEKSIFVDHCSKKIPEELISLRKDFDIFLNNNNIQF